MTATRIVCHTQRPTRALLRLACLGLRGVVLCALALLSAPALADPAQGALAGRWSGSYNCGTLSNNPFSLTVEPTHHASGELLAGIFRFAVPGAPEEEEGVFRVRGRFDTATRTFRFAPQEWIERPDDFTALGFEGRLHRNGVLIEGEISGCIGPNAGFAALRDGTPSTLPLALTPEPLRGGPWQGVWEGSLQCVDRRGEGQWPYRLSLLQQGSALVASHWLDWPQRDAFVRYHGVASGQLDASGQLTLEHRLWLSDPTRWAPSLTLSLAGDRLTGQVSGLPANAGCQSVTLTRVGEATPPTSAAASLQPGVWSGYVDASRPERTAPPSEWLRQLDRLTQITLTLDRQADGLLGQVNLAHDIDGHPMRQSRFAYRLQPLTTLADGRVAYAPLGITLAEGRLFADRASADSDWYARDPFVLLLRRASDGTLSVTRRNARQRETTLSLAPLDGEALAAIQRGEALRAPLADGLGGTLAQAPSLDQQCRALSEWAAAAGEETPLRRMTGTQLKTALLPLVADATFAPLFGLPLALTSAAERQAISQLTHVCERRTGARAPRILADQFRSDSHFNRLLALAMDRAESLGWLEEVLAEIQALEETRPSLSALYRIERDTRQRRDELHATDLARLNQAIADKRRAIALADFMQRVAAIPQMAAEDASLVRLSLLFEEASELRLPAESAQRLTRLATAKAEQILQPLRQQARDSLATATPSLDTLATLTAQQRHLERLRQGLPARVQQAIDFSAIAALAARRRQLIEHPAIHSAFQTALGEVTPGDDSPAQRIRRTALRYVDAQDLVDNAALAATVQRATERLELRAVGLVDRSTRQVPGAPSAQAMFFAIKARLDQINANLEANYTRCQRGDFQNDPLMAMTCLAILAAGNGQQLSARITRFEKLGCAPGQGEAGFTCDYVLGYATTSPFTRNTLLGELMSVGEVSQGRFVPLSGGWLFTPLRGRR